MVKTKHVRDVVHEANALEQYLDQCFAAEHVTFEQWVRRFASGFYKDRNELILNLAKPLRPRAVLEFASAGPFLARLLVENIDTIGKYTCSNFSTRMVEYCAAQLKDHHSCEAVSIDADVRRSLDMHRDRLAGYDLFITTSFEHIQFDCELLREFPIGSAFIFSVACFDDAEHFRVFETAEDIEARYGPLLRILDTRTNAEANKLVVLGVRRDADGAELPDGLKGA